MIPRNDSLFPPALIIQDEREQYRQQLKRQKEREQERAEQHDAWIDNLFHNQPYISIFDEYPWLKEAAKRGEGDLVNYA